MIKMLLLKATWRRSLLPSMPTRINMYTITQPPRWTSIQNSAFLHNTYRQLHESILTCESLKIENWIAWQIIYQHVVITTSHNLPEHCDMRVIALTRCQEIGTYISESPLSHFITCNKCMDDMTSHLHKYVLTRIPYIMHCHIRIALL